MVVLGKGVYLLMLWLPQNSALQVGKHGHFFFPGGFYIYVGSALGPNGLRKRLSYHLRRVKQPHWHIDYLRCITTVSAIWYAQSEANREHDWANLVYRLPGAKVIVRRFGASDCTCQSHLFHVVVQPSLSTFQALVTAHFACDTSAQVSQIALQVPIFQIAYT